MRDVRFLDLLIPQPGAYYVMDRGYIDFSRLYSLHQAKAFFVTRAFARQQIQRRYSHPVDKTTGLQSDQTIILTGPISKQKYPEPLRRIKFYDAQNDKRLVFLSNNFELPAMTIALLYKSRWEIEEFFKWIKQHLRIKSFFGTSENAVKTQIWTAVTAYVLIAIIKKRLALDQSLYRILQILSLVLFDKRPILQVLSEPIYSFEEPDIYNQLPLLNF